MIRVVGIGPGNFDLLTARGHHAIESAEVLFGSERQLLGLIKPHQRGINYKGNMAELVDGIRANAHLSIVVLASGDPLLYGVGSMLRRTFETVEIISGISSLHYIFTKIDQDMNDVYLTSAHGRTPNYKQWFEMQKIATVTDSVHTPSAIAAEYVKAGVEATFYVGSQLSYPDEIILKGKASEIQNRTFTGFSVVVIVSER